MFICTVRLLYTGETITKISNDNIAINLSWEQESGVSYDVHVTPNITVTFTATSSVQMTISYNVSYTVTIVGTLCSRNFSRAVEKFRYGELR